MLDYSNGTLSTDDWETGRIGQWMQTNSGGRFYPLDPREEEVHMSDIANGLSLDCRYGGQGRIDRFYSVAEHSYWMASYAQDMLHWDEQSVMATLLHDAAEAYINDLPRAVKHGAGRGYELMEAGVQDCILRKYQLTATMYRRAAEIKDLDRRIVPLEKAAIMHKAQPWAYDQFQPLEGIAIACWTPAYAKRRFLNLYISLCASAGTTPEEVSYE